MRLPASLNASPVVQSLLALPRPERFEHRLFRRGPWLALMTLVGFSLVLSAGGMLFTLGGIPGFLAVAVFFLGATLWVWIRRRRLAELMQRADEAATLLFAGQPHEAADKLDRVSGEARDLPAFQALCLLNRAQMALRMRERTEALPMLAEALRSGWLSSTEARQRAWLPHVLAIAAQAAAVRGEHADAAAWLELANGLGDDTRQDPLFLLPAVTHAWRQGRPAEASELIAASWERARAELPRLVQRELLALHRECLRATGDREGAEAIRQQLGTPPAIWWLE